MAKKSKNALEILHRRFHEGKPARLKGLEETRANEEIARTIRELRMAARVTQIQLAEMVGTTASMICRLEDADYEGHSLAILRRVAGPRIDTSRSASFRPLIKARFVPAHFVRGSTRF